MKKNLHLISVLTAVAVLLSTSGCGITQENRKGATLKIDLSKSFASELFQYRGSSVYPLTTVDSGLILERSSPKGVTTYLLYDPKTASFTEFTRERKDAASFIDQMPDGRYIFLYNEPTILENGTEDYSQVTRSAEIYNADLTLAESFELPEEMPSGYLSWNTIALDSNGNWLLFGNNDTQLNAHYSSVEAQETWIQGYYVLNSDFTVKGELDFDGYEANQLVKGTSGAIYGITGFAGGEGRGLYRFDCDKMTAELMDGMASRSMRTLMGGNGDYELYECLEDGIYGIGTDGTEEMVVDFMNSDLTDSVWNAYSMQDGTFLVYYMDEDSGHSDYYRMRPRTDQEIASTQIITLAGVSISRRLVNDVAAFNRSQKQYRIAMKDYAKEWADSLEDGTAREELRNAKYEWRFANIDYTPAIENFKQDLLSGIAPDIICMEDMPYQLISNKGLLCDLMPLLQHDERFDESAYLSNILGGLKRGDKLERIGFSFHVDTFAAKTEFVGEKQGLPPEEYLQMLQSIPEGMQYLTSDDRENLRHVFLEQGQGAFIDRNTMTCSFDSQAFVQLLEMVKAVQSAENKYADTQAYYEALQYGYNFAENHTLLYQFQVSRPISYHSVHCQDFRKADITLIGYPDSTGGNGGMYWMDYTIGLTAQSLMQEPVMEFILTQLGTQRQSKHVIEGWNSTSLPLHREMLENSLLGATRGYHDGGNLSEAEMAVLEDYIENVRMLEDIDPTVSEIIREEAGKYFSDDCSSQDAANAIQGRVSIYLSEMK